MMIFFIMLCIPLNIDLIISIFLAADSDILIDDRRIIVFVICITTLIANNTIHPIVIINNEYLIILLTDTNISVISSM